MANSLPFEKFILKHIFGVDQKLNVGIEYDDALRHHIVSMTGFVDSIAAAVLLYGLANLSGLFELLPGHSFSLSKFMMFVLLSTLFVDDFLSTRMYNVIIPCRTVGRFSLNLFVIGLFSLSFILFGAQSLNSTFAWLYLSGAYLLRSVWAIKTNYETLLWKSISEHSEPNSWHTKPKIPDGIPLLWNLYQVRVKRIGTFSFLYFVIFFFFFVFHSYKEIFDVTFPTLEEIIKASGYVDEIRFSEKTKFLVRSFLEILPTIMLLIIYGVVELYRFYRDVLGLHVAGLDNYIRVENYAFNHKSILFMPPILKRAGLKFFNFFNRKYSLGEVLND